MRQKNDLLDIFPRFITPLGVHIQVFVTTSSLTTWFLAFSRVYLFSPKMHKCIGRGAGLGQACWAITALWWEVHMRWELKKQEGCCSPCPGTADGAIAAQCTTQSLAVRGWLGSESDFQTMTLVASNYCSNAGALCGKVTSGWVNPPSISSWLSKPSQDS